MSLHVSTLLLAASLALAAPAATAGPPAYRITPIPTLGGQVNSGMAINAAGEVVGYSSTDTYGVYHAFRFSGGVSTSLNSADMTAAVASGINRHGQVVGSTTGLGPRIAFLHSGGQLSTLPIPENDNVSVAGINDRGQIAGTFTPVGASSHAFLLSNGMFKDLVGLESWGGSTASGINNKGELVGYSYTDGGYFVKAILYTGGSLKAIGYVGPFITQGFAVNDVGQVVGNTTFPPTNSSPQLAFVWDAANGIKLIPNLIGATHSTAYGINNAGHIVGNVSGSGWTHPFLMVDNTAHDLNALVVAPMAGRTLSYAQAINDSGQIVATACAMDNPYDCVAVRLDPLLPGSGNVVANPYGTMSVSGGSLAGTTLSITGTNATLQLGSTNGGVGSKAIIDFQGINFAPGTALTIKSGASNQTLVLNNVGPNATTVAGTIRAVGGNGAPPPAIVLKNSRGISVAAEGTVSSPSGVTLDALGATSTTGQGVLNFGNIDGGANLVLAGSGINGAATFKGDSIRISTFGNVNNPVYGVKYLSNSLQLASSTGQSLSLVLNGYGATAQVFNVNVKGNALVSMPSAWPAGSSLIPNNKPALPGSFRPAGAADPSFGGGSMILQATGSLMLEGGTSHDFVFPGGLVLKAGISIDYNGVAVVSGWTTDGAAWQGQFHEAPLITSRAPPIDIWLSDLNWVNFNVRPSVGVRAWQLRRQSNGSAQYVTADTTAPHLNTYSSQMEAAAAGECWICLVNSNPVDLH